MDDTAIQKLKEKLTGLFKKQAENEKILVQELARELGVNEDEVKGITETRQNSEDGSGESQC